MSDEATIIGAIIIACSVSMCSTPSRFQEIKIDTPYEIEGPLKAIKDSLAILSGEKYILDGGLVHHTKAIKDSLAILSGEKYVYSGGPLDEAKKMNKLLKEISESLKGINENINKTRGAIAGKKENELGRYDGSVKKENDKKGKLERIAEHLKEIVDQNKNMLKKQE